MHRFPDTTTADAADVLAQQQKTNAKLDVLTGHVITLTEQMKENNARLDSIDSTVVQMNGRLGEVVDLLGKIARRP